MDENWLQTTLRNQSHPSRDIQRKCHTDIVTGNKHKSHCMSYAGRPNFEQMMPVHKYNWQIIHDTPLRNFQFSLYQRKVLPWQNKLPLKDSIGFKTSASGCSFTGDCILFWRSRNGSCTPTVSLSPNTKN